MAGISQETSSATMSLITIRRSKMVGNRLSSVVTLILSIRGGMTMQWSEVRERFPNQFELVEELSSHLEGDMVMIDDMAVVRVVPDEEATKI